MAESYKYLPLPPTIPTIPKIDTYDVQEDATDIVNNRFGNDLQRMDVSLQNELKHMLGCGCGACVATFTEHVRESYDKTRVPDEDTGIMEHSVLQRYILFQYKLAK